MVVWMVVIPVNRSTSGSRGRSSSLESVIRSVGGVLWCVGCVPDRVAKPDEGPRTNRMSQDQAGACAIGWRSSRRQGVQSCHWMFIASRSDHAIPWVERLTIAGRHPIVSLEQNRVAL